MFDSNRQAGLLHRIDWSVRPAMPTIAKGDAMESRNTRDHLLQVGLRQIHSMGYASTGVKEILDEADVPKGSFYHYFASKEAFAKEVLALYVRGENELAEKILLGGKGATPKLLRP